MYVQTSLEPWGSRKGKFLDMLFGSSLLFSHSEPLQEHLGGRKKNVPRRAASGDSCGEGEEQTPGIFMGSWSLLYPISAERVKAGGNKAGLVMPYSRKNLRGTEMCLFQDKINKNKEYK